MKPLVLAYYLPAYHRIPENDKWYGEGFTEWTTTKKGVKFRSWQYQPRVPYKDNYYDLSDISVMREHAILAQKNNIDGFVFYHYWFNGKKILEKPVENLLKEKTIKIKYCLAWCNEEWRNTWNDKKGNFELLIEQRYDNPDDWENHFNYMLDFFLDDRYIKIDNKPVLMIYRIDKIPNYSYEITKWNELAKKYGFDGVYVIQMINGDFGAKINDEVISAKVDFEPNKSGFTHEKYAHNFWRFKRFIYNRFIKNTFLYKYILDVVNYKSFTKSIMKKKLPQNYFYSCFTDWDNTARKGKRGLIFKGSTPLLFKEFFRDTYSKSVIEKKPFVFIFAWNEWGEGAYLEPDNKFEYGYINSIKSVIDEFEEDGQ